VRLKQFLEMRGADCGPVPFLPALSAFWTGLLYDGASLDAAFDLIKPWDQQMRQSIRDEVPMAGLQTAVGKYQLGDVAREVLEMASSGLKARERLDGAGHDERCYLDVLLEIAEDGWTMSRRLIDRYKTEWGEDINAVYRSMAYKPD
jgi:glutamate--cysteine ligase